MRLKLKRFLSLALALVLLVPSGSMAVTAAEAAEVVGVQYNPDAKTADVVVFAHLQDDTQESADAYFAEKYDTFKSYFVGSIGRSFVNYLSKVSYGKHTVNVCFPQEKSDGTITSIAVPVSQAQAKQVNVDAQVIDAVLKAMPSLGQLAVDRDNDGYIDNLTIILKAESCSDADQGATLVAHSSNSGNMGTVSGYKVCNYNMLNTDRLEVTKYGLITHEYLHTLGFPDLYRTDGSKDYPVYIWDIMASVSDSPSYPLTYLRSKIGGWMTLGDITEDGTYTLSTQDSADGVKGFVIQSPLRDKEIFVVEYRKRPTNLYDQNSLDRMVQGSGIIVYRVDTTVQDYSNAKGYTGVWVFRPVEGMTGYLASNGLVNIVNAYLSSESGRTSIGSADLGATLEQGALTFANGENSGIVISEVGSAAGDTISFKVTFPDLTNTDLWSNTNFTSAASYPFKGVTIESIGEQVIAVEFDGSGFTAYKQCGDTWVKASSKLSASNYADCMKLFNYKNNTYLMYTDYGSGLVVKKLDLASGTWSSVTSLSTNGYYFDAEVVGDLVYVSYLQGDWGDKANMTTFNGTTLTDKGTYYTSSFANGEQRVVELNGAPCLFVRDAIGNVLNGYRYVNGSYVKITDGSVNVNSYDISVYNDKIYVASVNPDNSCLQISTYASGQWTTTGTSIDSAEATLTMMGENIYVLASPSSGDGNFRMYAFTNGEVKQEGDTAIDAAASGFTAISVGNKIYLSYVRISDKMSIVKSKVASGAGSGTGTGGEVIVPSNKKNIQNAVVTNDVNGVHVTYEGVALQQDVDYTVTDIEGIAMITGIGENYEGSITMEFENVCTGSTHLFATHNVVNDAAVAATCTTAGLTEGSHCSVCGTVIKAQTTVAATRHFWNDGVVTAEPTTESEGQKLYSCINCGNTKTETLPKLKPTYKETKQITLKSGDSVSFTDEAGDYEADYTAEGLDTSIAAVTVKGTTIGGSPAVPAEVAKLSSFVSGTYKIGTASGTYLTLNGTSLGTTTDVAEATDWTMSGSASSLTIQADGYYLSHGTSSVSISVSSTNGYWQYSSTSGFYYKSSGWFGRTYYMTYSGGFKMSTSASNVVNAYTVTEGTPAVPGTAVTDITFTGVNAGTTSVVIGETLYEITVVARKYQTVTVKSLDQDGNEIASAYTLTGEAGTSYTITPADINGYLTPLGLSGIYTEAPTAIIELYYEKLPNPEFVKDTNGIDADSEYVIAYGSKALAMDGSTLKAVDILVDGNNLNAADDSCVWVAVRSGSGYALKNKATGRYLSYSGNSRKCTLTTSTSATAWKGTLSSGNVRFSVTVSRTNFYLIYNNGFTMDKSTTRAGMGIYKKN